MKKKNTMTNKINQKIDLLDKIINLTSKKKSRVKGYCSNCRKPVFNLTNKWAKEGLCIFCWEMKTGDCKNHKWRAGSGNAEIVNGKLVTTSLNIWCENCDKKIKAYYSKQDGRRGK